MAASTVPGTEKATYPRLSLQNKILSISRSLSRRSTRTEISRKLPRKSPASVRTRSRSQEIAGLKIRYKGKSCFAQWQDVGPFGEDDFGWVFGSAKKPKNTQGLKAGLDISPATAQFLEHRRQRHHRMAFRGREGRARWPMEDHRHAIIILVA